MPLQILLIDDSESDQHLFKCVVERAYPDCAIQSAFDGNEAISLLDNQKGLIDIVFLDINMPGMNGYQFMEAYGEVLSKQKTPVYVLTSSSYKREGKLFTPYPCVVDLCSKSAGYDQVLNIISQYIDMQKLKLVKGKA